MAANQRRVLPLCLSVLLLLGGAAVIDAQSSHNSDRALREVAAAAKELRAAGDAAVGAQKQQQQQQQQVQPTTQRRQTQQAAADDNAEYGGQEEAAGGATVDKELPKDAPQPKQLHPRQPKEPLRKPGDESGGGGGGNDGGSSSDAPAADQPAGAVGAKQQQPGKKAEAGADGGAAPLKEDEGKEAAQAQNEGGGQKQAKDPKPQQQQQDEQQPSKEEATKPKEQEAKQQQQQQQQKDAPEPKGPKQQPRPKPNLPPLVSARQGAPVRTLLLTDCAKYQDWQTIAAAFAWRESGQPGALTRVANCNDKDRKGYPKAMLDYVDTFMAPEAAYNADLRDWYAAYNKPVAVRAWLDAHPDAKEEWVLLLDSDMLLRHAFKPEDFDLPAGTAAAGHYDYMKGVSNDLAKRHAAHIAPRTDTRAGPAGRRGDVVGAPYFMRTADARRIAPLWYDYTVQVRNDTEAYKDSGDTAAGKNERIWIAEMYGYAFGAATANVWHVWGDDFMLYPGYTPSVVPRNIHYGLHYRVDDWSFDKHWFFQFDVHKCPPWPADAARPTAGIFPPPPHPDALKSAKDYLTEYRDLLAVHTMALINAAVCDYHRRNCAPSPQLDEVCGKAEALYAAAKADVAAIEELWPCVNHNADCVAWAKRGECASSEKYMREHCRPACGFCKPTKRYVPRAERAPRGADGAATLIADIVPGDGSGEAAAAAGAGAGAGAAAAAAAAAPKNKKKGAADEDAGEADVVVEEEDAGVEAGGGAGDGKSRAGDTKAASSGKAGGGGKAGSTIGDLLEATAAERQQRTQTGSIGSGGDDGAAAAAAGDDDDPARPLIEPIAPADADTDGAAASAGGAGWGRAAATAGGRKTPQQQLADAHAAFHPSGRGAFDNMLHGGAGPGPASARAEALLIVGGIVTAAVLLVRRRRHHPHSHHHGIIADGTGGGAGAGGGGGAGGGVGSWLSFLPRYAKDKHLSE